MTAENIKRIEKDWNSKNIRIKDRYGFFLSEHKGDFEISIYDLEKNNKVGEAKFLLVGRDDLAQSLGMNLDDTYSSNYRISDRYQGQGLSRILVEETLKVLKEKKKAHMPIFWKKKGVERMKKQFEREGYEEKIPINPLPKNYHNTCFLYKRY